MGFAYVLKPTPALCKTPEEREQLKFAMERKKRAFNNTKSFLKDLREISMEEICENYKTAYYKDIGKSNPEILKLVTGSSIEDAAKKAKEQEEVELLRDKFYHELYENTKND
ncbi:MAG: hypothetical protein LUG16_05865 [Candidatus Gastranaerophilales bacterium]|nr:hypothetical protein [Candidatus Gastranaerophilales bacterium]